MSRIPPQGTGSGVPKRPGARPAQEVQSLWPPQGIQTGPERLVNRMNQPYNDRNKSGELHVAGPTTLDTANPIWTTADEYSDRMVVTSDTLITLKSGSVAEILQEDGSEVRVSSATPGDRWIARANTDFLYVIGQTTISRLAISDLSVTHTFNAGNLLSLMTINEDTNRLYTIEENTRALALNLDDLSLEWENTNVQTSVDGNADNELAAYPIFGDGFIYVCPERWGTGGDNAIWELNESDGTLNATSTSQDFTNYPWAFDSATNQVYFGVQIHDNPFSDNESRVVKASSGGLGEDCFFSKNTSPEDADNLHTVAKPGAPINVYSATANGDNDFRVMADVGCGIDHNLGNLGTVGEPGMNKPAFIDPNNNLYTMIGDLHVIDLDTGTVLDTASSSGFRGSILDDGSLVHKVTGPDNLQRIPA